jgi:hypothetical protein
LYLALFIHRQHQRVFGRVEIKSHYIFELFCEPGIVADLEAVDAMRLNRLRKNSLSRTLSPGN